MKMQMGEGELWMDNLNELQIRRGIEDNSKIIFFISQ